MKKFRAILGINRIEEFEIVKETEKQVQYVSSYGGIMRDHKVSSHHIWGDTKEEVIEAMILNRQKEIESLNNRIVYLNSDIEKIKNL